MTRRADFNAEEWSTVVNGPLYAGMRVISADRGGRLRETAAMGRVYQEARERHGESELLDDLIKSPPSSTQTSSAWPAEISRRSHRNSYVRPAGSSRPRPRRPRLRTTSSSCGQLRKPWPTPTRREGFLASAASRSATPRIRRSTKSPQRWGLPRRPETTPLARKAPSRASCESCPPARSKG
jgi:hypothetical protein